MNDHVPAGGGVEDGPQNRLSPIIWKVLAADKEEGELISASITD